MSTHYESISYNKDLEGYIFANDNNIVYFVYFREDLSFEDSFVLKNKVLFTGFHTIPENAELVYDSKTYHTISHIILRNIRLNPEVAVTYICDSKDGRQAARNRLFNMWFKEHPK